MVANYPDILTRSALFALSPVPDAAIEIGFIGDNVDTLVAFNGTSQRDCPSVRPGDGSA